MITGDIIDLITHNGFGGKKAIVMSDKDQSCEFIVKCEKIGQSVNEFMAHRFLAALGYSVPKANIIKITNCFDPDHALNTCEFKCFGGIEYIKDAHNISMKEIMIRSYDIKQLVYELIFMKYIMNDSDEALQMMYSGSIGTFLVDLGETLISDVYIDHLIGRNVDSYLLDQVKSALLQQYSLKNVNEYIKRGTKACMIYSDDRSEEIAELISTARGKVLKRITMLDNSRMKKCFDEIELVYGSSLAECFRLLFRELRKNADIIIKQL